MRAWRLEAHAENEDQLHHVRLCIEGIPVHGWNNYVAMFVIGRGCSLDYIENRSLRREDTRYLALWAWTANPDAIPKLKWLTLPARGQRRRRRRGLRHRMLIHLDLHEDHSNAREDGDNPPAPDVNEFIWYPGIVDGAPPPGRRHAAPAARDDRRNARRDDADDRDGGRGRDGSRGRTGWGDRIRRSLSRNARERQRGANKDRSRDRSGGGRRHDVAPMGMLAAITTRDEVRGRSPVRQASPRSGHRLAHDNLTPPNSPTSVLPSTPGSKHGGSAASSMSAAARGAVVLCAPAHLVSLLPSLSPARPWL